MKKVVRLTERDLIRLVENVGSIYLNRRTKYIDEILDETISEITSGKFHFKDYDDYKSEVIWSTLSTMEYDEGRDLPKEYIEDYFSFMERPEFIEKIKRGYSMYKNMFKKNRK
jgi:hypothetical protein